MNKLAKCFLIFLFISFFCSQQVPAHILEELWNKYAPVEMKETRDIPVPGKILGKSQGTGAAAFDYPWKYRRHTYEMHFQNPEDLARAIYSLALHARDVSPDLPVEKFYGGVLGFHYSGEQVADWLNEVLSKHLSLNKQENEFAGLMLEIGLVKIGKNGFQPGSSIRHVLGAAPGNKRKFANNLRHERLHVFWDEDKLMRDNARKQWNSFSETEKNNIRQELKNYAQDNERQLIEEWAVKQAEKSNMSIK